MLKHIVLLSLQFCSIRVHETRKALSFETSTRCCVLHGINSVLGDRKSSANSNGTPEPARVLLERLFAQTQKLEEHMNGNAPFFQSVESDFSLENLESDLEAALEALRKKEEDLQEAERMVMLEDIELKQARENLECREKEIAVICSKQDKLEEELRQANLKLVSQARHIEDLKLQLKERDQKISERESALLFKVDQMDKMRFELECKNEEAAKNQAQLVAKAHLLDEANEVVEKQDIELRELRNALRAKEKEIEEFLCTQHLEAEKLKAAEAKLEKQTTEWMLAQEELRKLGQEASKHVKESKETVEDFQRVKRLLTDVRSELVLSQKSLVTLRQKMEGQELVLEKQLLELDEQKETIESYIYSLKNAQIEVESERAKLRVAEARNKDLGLDLSLKRDLLQNLQEQLNKEKYSLQQAIDEVSFLRKEMIKKNSEFEETCNLLEVKEKELVEAKLEIQHLISERSSLHFILQERDSELNTAKKRLEEVNTEVAELKMLLNKKEDQLILATGMLKEKDDYAEAMQCELDDARLKASEAESVVGRIVDLTKELVISTKEENFYASGGLGELPLQFLEKPAEDFKWQKKQLEDELELRKENLRAKEMELLAAQRQLAIKEEELEMVLQRLEERDREVKALKEERLGDVNDMNSLDDLVIEKLLLEVEAATSALHKLAEMSGELLNKASLSIESDLDVNFFQQNGFTPKSCEVGDVVLQNGLDQGSSVVENKESLREIKSEVVRLSALTEMLVQEASSFSATRIY